MIQNMMDNGLVPNVQTNVEAAYAHELFMMDYVLKLLDLRGFSEKSIVKEEM